MDLCKGKTKAGGECRMRPPAGQEFCVNHGGTGKAKPDAAEKPAGKGSAASPGKRGESDAGVGIAIGAGIALAALAVYAAWKYAARLAAAAAPKLAAVRRIAGDA